MNEPVLTDEVNQIKELLRGSSAIICLCGLPRSGKSTLARQLSIAINAPIVSPDAIRLSLHGTSFRRSVEGLVWGMSDVMVDALLWSGHERIIFDATSITPQARRKVFREGIGRVIVWVDTPIKTCIERATSESLKRVIFSMDQNWMQPEANEADYVWHVEN